jgi:hypothetical protein
MKIEKKILEKYFEKILSGDKSYELRLADWECNVGDLLILKEVSNEKKEYTGRTLEKEVTSVLKTKDVDFWPREDVEKYGYQIISFK